MRTAFTVVWQGRAGDRPYTDYRVPRFTPWCSARPDKSRGRRARQDLRRACRIQRGVDGIGLLGWVGVVHGVAECIEVRTGNGVMTQRDALGAKDLRLVMVRFFPCVK